MKTTTELQEQIIEACHNAKACEGQFKQLLSVKDNPIHFVRMLLNDHSWYVYSKIYTAESIRQFDPEILLRAGLATQETMSVDFDPVPISGLLFSGLNIGATIEDVNGDYMTWDDAMKLKLNNKRVPTDFEQSLLCAKTRHFGSYSNNFGLVFEGDDNRQLFIPASGYRSSSSAVLQYIGYGGRYWSASSYPSSPHYSYFLYFYFNGGVGPSNTNSCSNGFAVRCIAE